MSKRKSKSTTSISLARGDVLRVAAEAQVDPRTVAAAYAGGGMKGLTRDRVVAAAEKLKLPAPPEPKS